MRVGDRIEPCFRQALYVIHFFKRTRDAADPQFHALSYFGGNFAAYDDVGDRETAARLQNTRSFAEYLILVAGEIDDAIRDDDIDRIVGQRDVLDLTLEELDVGQAA